MESQAFEWATAVKLPIRTVSMIVVKDDQRCTTREKTAKATQPPVLPRGSGLYPSVDEQDKPVYDGHPDWNKKPVEVIRKGQVNYM